MCVKELFHSSELIACYSLQTVFVYCDEQHISGTTENTIRFSPVTGGNNSCHHRHTHTHRDTNTGTQTHTHSLGLICINTTEPEALIMGRLHAYKGGIHTNDIP